MDYRIYRFIHIFKGNINNKRFISSLSLKNYAKKIPSPYKIINIIKFLQNTSEKCKFTFFQLSTKIKQVQKMQQSDKSKGNSTF